MYEDGIQSLIQGWTKHFSVGANKTQPQIMLAIVMWLMGSITSTLTLLISVFTKPASRIVSYLFYVLYTCQFVRLHRRVGAFQWYCSYYIRYYLSFSYLSSQILGDIRIFLKRSNGKVVHLK